MDVWKSGCSWHDIELHELVTNISLHYIETFLGLSTRKQASPSLPSVPGGDALSACQESEQDHRETELYEYYPEWNYDMVESVSEKSEEDIHDLFWLSTLSGADELSSQPPVLDCLLDLQLPSSKKSRQS